MSTLRDGTVHTVLSQHNEDDPISLRPNESFSTIVRALMEKYDLSEHELAKACQLSQATVHRIITGNTDPKLSTLRAISTHFEVTVEQLIGDYPLPTIMDVETNKTATAKINTPTLIPILKLPELPQYFNNLSSLTLATWNEWHVTGCDVDAGCYATKIPFHAGILFPTDSILVVSYSDLELIQPGDCIVFEKNTNIAIGQVDVTSGKIIVKNEPPVDFDAVKVYGKILLCEIQVSNLAKYVNCVST